MCCTRLAANAGPKKVDLHEIFKEGWQWTTEHVVKFWWQFGSPSGYTGIVFRIRHYWEILKVLYDIKSAAVCSHSFILIRQMAAVVIIKLENTDSRQLYLQPTRQSPDGGTDIATLSWRRPALSQCIWFHFGIYVTRTCRF